MSFSPSLLRASDCIDWMHVNEADLDELLQGGMKEYDMYDAQHGESVLDEDEDSEVDSDETQNTNSQLPDKLVSTMNDFMHNESSYQGVVVPNGTMSGDDDVMLLQEGISFDIDNFYKVLQGLDDIIVQSEDEVYNSVSNEGAEGTMDQMMKDVMHEMDEELYANNNGIGKSFTRIGDLVNTDNDQPHIPSALTTNDKEGVEAYQGVDIDINLVSNLLESFSLQEGMSGPASNVCRDLGIRLEYKS